MKGQQEERRRLVALRGYGLLDTPNEAAFDPIVQQTSRADETIGFQPC